MRKKIHKITHHVSVNLRIKSFEKWQRMLLNWVDILEGKTTGYIQHVNA